MKKETIAIIWWTGNFWKFWHKYFEQNWFNVIISGRSTEIKPIDAVKISDIIIISVPIRYTVTTIKEIIPFIPDDKLLIDFTWIKTEASIELSKYTKGEVVSTHPMFWPWVKWISWQNIAFDPIDPWKKWNNLFNLLKKDGAKLIELESNKHDELVSIVQSTVHVMNLVLWHVLKERWINIEELMKISTPNSRMQLRILSRFLKQEASLYTDMQIYNTMYKNEILPDIEKYFKNLECIIENKDTNKFENEFNSIKEYIWKDFIEEYFNITKKLDI